MVEDEIYKSLALAMGLSLGIINDAYGYYFMFNDEKMMGYSVSLVMEIDELLDMGYIKEKIIKIIMECDFVKIDPELTKEQAEYLRMYSLRMLDVRYKLYLEEKDEKVKKYLFNK